VRDLKCFAGTPTPRQYCLEWKAISEKEVGSVGLGRLDIGQTKNERHLLESLMTLESLEVDL
jgi:hypothetical protein